MIAVATIIGSAGVVLLMVGLVGGGFTFSGGSMPRVDKASRKPCLAVGGVLVLLSVGMAVTAELRPVPAGPASAISAVVR